MHRGRACLFVALLFGSGCGASGDQGSTEASDSGGDRTVVVEGDGAADATPDASEEGVGTGPPCLAPSAAGMAGLSVDGVLTNLPTLRFTKASGTLDIVTAYFEVTKLSGFNSLVAWGDVVNRTRMQQCIPAADQFDIGDQSVLTVVDGPAYELPGSTVPIVCFEPGARGVFRSIQNDVGETLLDVPKTITYAFSTLALSPPSRQNPDDPRVVSALATSTEGGWTLRGEMRAGLQDIHALEARVYIRDPNGLLYNYLPVQIASRGTIAAQSSFSFETPPNGAEFCGYELFDVFIDGSEPMHDGGSEGAAPEGSASD